MRTIMGDVRAAAETGKTTKSQLEAAWHALEGTMELYNQVEEATGLASFAKQLNTVLESAEYFDELGKPTAKRSRHSRSTPRCWGRSASASQWA